MHTGKLILAATVFCLMAEPVTAAVWTTPAGTTDSISYANGQDLNGHFGNPNVAEQKFVFANPIDFRAVSPGTPVSVTDQLSFDVSTPPGLQVEKITARIIGNYSFTGDSALLDYTAQLTLNNGLVGALLSFVPPPPIAGGEGEFVGTATIIAAPTIIVTSVELSSMLEATSIGGGTATIQINNAQIAFTVIPEPASIGLLGGVASLLLRRRR